MNYAEMKWNFHNKLLPKSLKRISNFVCHSQDNRIEQVIYGEAVGSDAHQIPQKILSASKLMIMARLWLLVLS